jgi:hypothetical protein
VKDELRALDQRRIQHDDRQYINKILKDKKDNGCDKKDMRQGESS